MCYLCLLDLRYRHTQAMKQRAKKLPKKWKHFCFNLATIQLSRTNVPTKAHACLLLEILLDMHAHRVSEGIWTTNPLVVHILRTRILRQHVSNPHYLPYFSIGSVQTFFKQAFLVFRHAYMIHVHTYLHTYIHMHMRLPCLGWHKYAYPCSYFPTHTSERIVKSDLHNPVTSLNIYTAYLHA
jgi:hypothetical protein